MILISKNSKWTLHNDQLDQILLKYQLQSEICENFPLTSRNMKKHFHDFQQKLTICDDDRKLLVMNCIDCYEQTTLIISSVIFVQMCDGHIQITSCKCGFIHNAVSAVLSSGTSRCNKIFITWVLTQVPRASSHGKGTQNCDILSFSSCIKFCIDETNVSIRQPCWKRKSMVNISHLH